MDNYVLEHREAPPAVGLLVVGEDFGEGEEPPVDADLVQVRLELAQVRALLDDARYINRAADPDFAWTEIGEASRILEIVESRLGKAEPVPGPEPTPVPVPLRGFTARTHWEGSPYALDVYAGPKGTPIRLKLGGTAEGWGSITPLRDHPQTAPSHWTLNEAWSSGWGVSTNPTAPSICMQTLGEMMFTWVLRATNGNSYAISHVLQAATFGAVVPWQTVALLGDSGIQGLCGSGCPDCQPAHMHVFGWWGHGPMPSNGLGTIPGVLVCDHLGIEIEEWVSAIPGPQQYQACQAKAGRFT